MHATRQNARRRRLHVPMCLRCGYDGARLRGELASETFVCPACGEDLYARPPRSYAELEGLTSVGDARTPGRALCDGEAVRPCARRILVRWLRRLIPLR